MVTISDINYLLPALIGVEEKLFRCRHRSYKTFAANTAIALPDLNQILFTAIGRRENGTTGLGIARQVCSQQSVKVFLIAAISQYLCTIIRDTALHSAWSRLVY